MGVFTLLCVVLCGICGGNAAFHSLKYIYTAVTGDTDSLDFTIMGLVDDEQFVHYDSNIRRMIPETEWMKKSVDNLYWDKQTQKALNADQIFKNNTGIAMQHHKSTQGQHILEWTVGCEWDDKTGNTEWIERYVYDWKRFFPDAINWNFIPPAQQLFIHAVKWNSAELENYSQTQTCIESLKQYVSYRRSTLERTAHSPEGSSPPTANSFSPEGSSSPMGIIIGCVVGALILILILILAAIGVVMRRRRSSGYVQTSTPDEDSQTLIDVQLLR